MIREFNGVWFTVARYQAFSGSEAVAWCPASRPFVQWCANLVTEAGRQPTLIKVKSAKVLLTDRYFHFRASVGKNHARSMLHSKLTLNEAQDNWLLGSTPTPNATEGWRISSVLLRYTIRGRAGVIDRVGLRDGENPVHSYDGLAAGPIAGWQTMTLPLSPPRTFSFGLGVSIHANYPDNFDPQPLGPAEFLFVSVGSGFSREP